jgi:hypothetical protein
MAKAKIAIELEIEYDELQYETDGFIGINNVIENFKEEFKPNSNEIMIGYDFSFKVVNNPKIIGTDIK